MGKGNTNFHQFISQRTTNLYVGQLCFRYIDIVAFVAAENVYLCIQYIMRVKELSPLYSTWFLTEEGNRQGFLHIVLVKKATN